MAKQDDAVTNPQFTIGDVLDLLKQINKDNQENLKSAIAEMKKPTAAEQAKLDKENALLARKAEIRRAEMILEEKNRKEAQAACQHKKKSRNGAFVSAWGGQVNSNGYWYPLCTVCQMIGPEVKAPVEWLTGGVNATDMENPIWASLDLATLREWQRKTGGPAPRPKLMSWTEEEKKEVAV